MHDDSIDDRFREALDTLVAQIKDDRAVLAVILCGLLVTGTPEDVAACKSSHTGLFLKACLKRAPR
jgi:hypothetical protein